MSFWRTYYHLVWATYRRQPLITPELERQLFPYLVERATALGVHVLAINGWTDHVHLVVAIPPKLAVAEVVKELKGPSARYIHTLVQTAAASNASFAWQEGYGVLTIGERHCHIAVEYVQRQKEHHAAHEVNAWLERVEDEDVGPRYADDPADRRDVVLRERQANYDVAPQDDELPF